MMEGGVMEEGDRESLLGELERLLSDLSDVDRVRDVVSDLLRVRTSPVDIIDAVSRGLELVGERYERGEYFLSELIMAGIISSEISEMLRPHLTRTSVKPVGKVVIGTVRGDLHDIGKNIVSMMLSSAGFEVIDLGIDVPPEKFIEAIKNEKPNIVAMSCLLTVALEEMRNTMEEIRKSGLRDAVKIMIGGRPVTREFAAEIGADAYGSDAVEAVKVAKTLIKEGTE